MESHSLSPSACLLGSLVFSLMLLDVRSFPTPHLSLVTPFSVYCGSLHPSSCAPLHSWFFSGPVASSFPHPFSHRLIHASVCFQSSAHSCFRMLSFVFSFAHSFFILWLIHLLGVSVPCQFVQCEVIHSYTVCCVILSAVTTSDLVACSGRSSYFNFLPFSSFSLLSLSLPPSPFPSFFPSFCVCIYG